MCRFPILAIVVTIVVGALYLPAMGNVTDEYCNQTYVSFTFDDGFDTVMDANEILLKYGYKGTAFITTELIGVDGHLSADQIKYLYISGWEIGSHTVTHPDLTAVDHDQMVNELELSKKTLEDMGITVHSFASPYGKYNSDTIDEIANYYTIHRTGDGIYNTIPVEDMYHIKAFEVKQNTPVEDIKQMVTYANDKHLWLVLIFHKIDDTSEYGYSKDKFEEVVEFVREMDYTNSKMVL